MSEEVHDLNTPSDADKLHAVHQVYQTELARIREANASLRAEVETLRAETGAVKAALGAAEADRDGLRARNAELEALSEQRWQDRNSCARLADRQTAIAKQWAADLSAKTAELERVRAEFELNRDAGKTLREERDALIDAEHEANARYETERANANIYAQQLAAATARAEKAEEKCTALADALDYWGYPANIQRLHAAESQFREARGEIEKLRELVRRAIEDGWKCSDEATRALTGGGSTAPGAGTGDPGDGATP